MVTDSKFTVSLSQKYDVVMIISFRESPALFELKLNLDIIVSLPDNNPNGNLLLWLQESNCEGRQTIFHFQMLSLFLFLIYLMDGQQKQFGCKTVN